MRDLLICDDLWYVLDLAQPHHFLGLHSSQPQNNPQLSKQTFPRPLVAVKIGSNNHLAFQWRMEGAVWSHGWTRIPNKETRSQGAGKNFPTAWRLEIVRNV